MSGLRLEPDDPDVLELTARALTAARNLKVVTPHLPAGVAILGDFRELALFMRDSIRIDIATQGNPTGTQDCSGRAPS